MNKNKIHADWFLTMLFFIAFVLWRGSYYRISLYVLIPMLIVFSFFRFGKTILSSKYWLPYLLLIFWMLLSSLVNENQSDSMRRMIPVVASFLLSFSAYALALRGNNAKVLYMSYCVFFVVLMVSLFREGGVVADFDYGDESVRTQSLKMNANSYAYYSFFLIMSVRMLLEEKKNKPNMTGRVLVYLVLIAIGCYTSLLTASRQVMYIEIPLVALFIYVDFIKSGEKTGRKMFYVVLLMLAVVMFLPVFMSYYEKSFLASRSQIGFNEDTRSRMIIQAFHLALENPLFGVGLGADITFSHCTYAHLASRCGLMAFVIYSYMLLKFIFIQWGRYLIKKDNTYLLFFFCGLFYALGNIVYSYIDGPFMMSMLFILAGDSERYYRETNQLAQV